MMSEEPRTTDDKRPAPDEVLRVRCRVMSRIVGYLSAIEDWNPGKVSEWQERKPYKIPNPEMEEEH
jgi:hypothetical protein